jgi:two-component system NtrC family sensor kinase
VGDERIGTDSTDAERLLRSVVEALDGGVCIVCGDGTILDANQQWLRRVAQYDHQTPAARATAVPGSIGTSFFDWCATAVKLGGLAKNMASLVAEVINSPEDGSSDQDGVNHGRSVKGLVRVGGEDRWFVVRVHRIRDHVVGRAVVSMIDITEGMATQEKLRRATEDAQRLALVARSMDNSIVITLPDGIIEWVNDPFVWRSGYSFEEVVGQPRSEFLHSVGDLTEFRDFLARVGRAQAADGEFQLVSRAGERYWAAIQVRPVFDEDDAVAHLVWVERDITASRDTQQRLHAAIAQAEQLAAELSQEKTLLTGVISAVPQMVFWKDGVGRYVGCNAAYLAFRGVDEEELLGRTDAELPYDDLAVTLAELEPTVVTTGGPIIDRKTDLRDSEGRLRALLLSVLPLQTGAGESAGRGVIGVGADITRARELEHQLAQANRLESIGQLAAGIAHELNTPIQYVADNTAFLTEATSDLITAVHRVEALVEEGHPGMERVAALLEPLDLDFLSEEIPGSLSESKEGLSRVAEIVRAMKDYAHPGSGRREMNINRAVQSTVQVCRNEWKYVAQVELDLDPDAGQVPCFEGELKQVILNIIVNAAQALAEDPRREVEKRKGTITIRTRRTDDEFLIVIRDDGPGMEEKVRRRAFDPFFTTKDVGKGSGQGLSLVHSVIVTKHQGRIDLETAPGEGACFTLHLPLAATDPGEDGPTGPV